MIKKILALGIIILGFVSFSNAGTTLPIAHDSYNSNVDGIYKITFLKGGGFLTNYLGQGRSMLALRNNVLVRRATNGFPYFYLQSSNTPNFGLVQGFPDRYLICDEITEGQTTEPGNCSESEIRDYSGNTTNIKENLQTFFKKVNLNDLVYYEFTDWNREVYIHLCRNSSEIGNSLCFKVGKDNGYISGNVVYHKSTALINSQNLTDMTFAKVQNSRIGYAPGQNGYDGNYAGNSEGAVDSNINISITGDYVYSDCTRNDILIALESEGYNKYVCYGGIDNFQLYDPELSYNPIAGTGLSISQIWANSSARAWDNFPDWFTFWEGLYLDSSDNNYNAMWSSYPAVYHTYFQMYNSYGGGLDPRTLLEYCQLRTLTGDSLNNSAGGYFKPACETVIREKQTGLRDCRVNGTLYSGCEQNPQVALGTNWNGVGNLSGVVVKTDGLTFIQDFFNLMKSKLQTSGFLNNFVGIIPGYIIVFLLGIILFRFISH